MYTHQTSLFEGLSMREIEHKTEVFVVTEMGEQVEERNTVGSQRRRVFECYVQPCLAELVGTSLFVFVGCASVIGNAQESGVTQPALAHGLALGVMIMMFGQISGGHFNPAVSLSAFLCGGLEFRLLLPYILSQVSGGMVGAGLTQALFSTEAYNAASGGAFDIGTGDMVKCMLAEVVMTTSLTMVVVMGAINGRTRSAIAPFCIGLTVTANIFAGGLLSGACMNPARAFGSAVAANYWNHHWIFWVGPTCGALVTGALIKFLLGDRKTRIVLN